MTETGQHPHNRIDPTGIEIRVELPDDTSTRRLGQALADVVRAGDVVVLTGELGAGKTTLTQGIGAGLQVRGAITSPTFVIARVHPSQRLGGGPALVHVDAYRLGNSLEFDDLDLDTDLSAAVVVVEWGDGLAEGLSGDRLHVRLIIDAAAAAGDEALADWSAASRRATITPVGSRWDTDAARAGLLRLAEPAAGAEPDGSLR